MMETVLTLWIILDVVLHGPLTALLIVVVMLFSKFCCTHKRIFTEAVDIAKGICSFICQLQFHDHQ